MCLFGTRQLGLFFHLHKLLCLGAACSEPHDCWVKKWATFPIVGKDIVLYYNCLESIPEQFTMFQNVNPQNFLTGAACRCMYLKYAMDIKQSTKYLDFLFLWMKWLFWPDILLLTILVDLLYSLRNKRKMVNLYYSDRQISDSDSDKVFIPMTCGDTTETYNGCFQLWYQLHLVPLAINQ